MDLILDGFAEAFRLIASGDRDLLQAALLSLEVSLSAVLIAVVLGVPAGAVLALTRFPLRRVALVITNTLMGLPPVVAGLLVVMLLWRSGPLGGLEWLYTPIGMIFAQALVALPIVTGLSASAYQSQGQELPMQLAGLGASPLQVFHHLTVENRLPLLSAVMAALGRVFAEVGAVIMVGGNIRGETRVLTTAIVLETRRGNLETALAFAIVLLAIAMLISLALTGVAHRAGARVRGR